VTTTPAITPKAEPGKMTKRPAPTTAVTTDRTKRLQSLYVLMRDGVRIAVDVWLPTTAAVGKVPTAIRATRYHRANASASIAENPNLAEADRFGTRGYALVLVDARGSGASFGTRTGELSPDELDDYGEVLDWIGAQPWSNGRVGSYGVSYDGDTAELMARAGSKHLVAIAPLFSDFDTYRQLAYPGGIYLNGFFDSWLPWTQLLDGMEGAVERAKAAGVPDDFIQALSVPPAPVDGPDGPALLAAALKDHQGNARLDLTIPANVDRDNIDWEQIAASTHRKAIEASGVAVFVQASWLDAATQAGTLERFASFANTQEIWLGPWNHGGGTAIDPSRPNPPAFEDISSDAQFDRQLAFFDKYVRDGAKPDGSKSLHFTSFGSDTWTETAAWPPRDVRDKKLFLTDGGLVRERGRFSKALPTADQSSGANSRWFAQLGATPDYSTWSETKDSRLSLPGETLTKPLRLCGFPVVTVEVTTDETDGTIFAYLEQVAPDGTTSYITEGQLRLSKRGMRQPRLRTDQRLDRSFTKADAAPMTPGKAETIVFELFPTSAVIPAGNRLQLSFASSDIAAFSRYAKPESVVRVSSRWSKPANLTLPVLRPHSHDQSENDTRD
jgi:uncharacterized protein